MATTEWKIVSIKACKELNDKTNVVSQIQWMITVFDGDKSSSIFGNQDLQIDTSNFVSFDRLTEQTMVNWVKTAMGNEQVAAFEAKAIASMTPVQTVNNAPVVVALPWVK
jgi:hypothetical protein